jgi:hypothetical protein
VVAERTLLPSRQGTQEEDPFGSLLLPLVIRPLVLRIPSECDRGLIYFTQSKVRWSGTSPKVPRHITSVLEYALFDAENYMYVGKLEGTRTRRQFSVRTAIHPILSLGPRGGPEWFRLLSKRRQLSVQRVARRNRRSQVCIKSREVVKQCTPWDGTSSSITPPDPMSG